MHHQRHGSCTYTWASGEVLTHTQDSGGLFLCGVAVGVTRSVMHRVSKCSVAQVLNCYWNNGVCEEWKAKNAEIMSRRAALLDAQQGEVVVID